MSGHSKFANIKHRKAKTDAARGKIFTKIGREIAVAVKAGGPEPSANASLRDVIAKAKSSNMPNDTIERSIKKAAGEAGGISYETVTYEGYGPCGVAVIVEALTDNKNRTASNVRSAFTKGGGNMGATGCVGFLFDRRGLIMVEKDAADGEDSLMELALEAGASDFSAEEEGFEIITEPENLHSVREALESAKITMVSAEVTMIPQTWQKVSGDEAVKGMNKLLDMLEEDDDVQNVYHNMEE
jgi:YebC/PmpR family DNA-binding regulatory protein